MDTGLLGLGSLGRVGLLCGRAAWHRSAVGLPDRVAAAVAVRGDDTGVDTGTRQHGRGPRPSCLGCAVRAGFFPSPHISTACDCTSMPGPAVHHQGRRRRRCGRVRGTGGGERRSLLQLLPTQDRPAHSLRSGAGLAVGFAAAPHGTAHAAPAGVDAYAYEVGDDNGDGRIDEDESGWDCVTIRQPYLWPR